MRKLNGIFSNLVNKKSALWLIFCTPKLTASCFYMTLSRYGKRNLILEATVGFEPTNEGFADPCLTRLGYVAVL